MLRLVVSVVALAMIPIAALAQPGVSDAPVRLRFRYSSDATDLLEGPIARFNALHVGQIEVDGMEGSSGTIESEIAQGEEQPELWMPASSIWGRLLNFDTRHELVPETNPSLFYSPEVFATWQDVNELLEAKIGPMGWRNLFELNERDVAEGNRGPLGELSPFRFGHTRATTSTSGLYDVVSQYAVAMDLPPAQLEDFDPERMRDPDVVDRVRDFELSVRNYGDVAEDFCPPLAKYRSGNYSALYMQETTLLKCRIEHGADQLLEFHPEEGAFVADYPLILLSADWVDPAEREAAEEFRTWLAANLSDEAILGEYLRAGDPWDDASDVAPPEAVGDASTFTPLPIPDAAVLAQARLAWQGLIRKVGHVVILLDHSDGMSTDGRWAEACVMLQHLLEELNDRNHAGLVTFDGDVTVEVKPARIQDEHLVTLIEALDPMSSPASGDTAQLSAGIMKALRLKTVDDDAINLLIVVSTGQDNSSESTKARALAALGKASDDRSPVQVFTVFMGGPGKGRLAALAEEGKGTAYDLTGPDTPNSVVKQLSSLVPVHA